MNFSGKEGHPNIQPSTRPGIEPGTSGLGGRDLNHCANPSALLNHLNGKQNFEAFERENLTKFKPVILLALVGYELVDYLPSNIQRVFIK